MIDPLVERARRGDAQALDELLTQLAPAVHRFGARMCRDPRDAEDVLQDTLLAVATHLPEFEGRASLSSWVFALARSACARRRRGLKNQRPASVDEAPEPRDEAPDPEQRAAGHELASVLSGALAALPEDYREVLLLRDVEGLTAPEAAGALGLTVDALKSRLHRARGALREALRPALEPSAPAAESARPAAGAAATAGCPDVVALWSRKLEGDLHRDDCAAMEKHLAGCPACGAACDALKRALLACQHAASPTASPAIRARVQAALAQWAAQRGVAPPGTVRTDR